jgi:hypothetical protein
VKCENTAMDRVPISDIDYLTEDPEIRGQKYACISYINPEEIVKSKQIFMLSKFVEGFSKAFTILFDELKEKFPTEADGLRIIKENYGFVFEEESMQEDYQKFLTANPSLEKVFDEANSYRTSIRGVKVRGSYDTVQEAQARAETLKRLDDGKHNILIGQVGCWVPLTVNVDDIEKQEYAETELNTLMKKYKENEESKEIAYNLRKDTLMKTASTHDKLINSDSIVRPPSASTVPDDVIRGIEETI